MTKRLVTDAEAAKLRELFPVDDAEDAIGNGALHALLDTREELLETLEQFIENSNSCYACEEFGVSNDGPGDELWETVHEADGCPRLIARAILAQVRGESD